MVILPGGLLLSTVDDVVVKDVSEWVSAVADVAARDLPLLLSQFLSPFPGVKSNSSDGVAYDGMACSVGFMTANVGCG